MGLVSCSVGVGEGTYPVDISITVDGGGAGSTQALECTQVQLGSLLKSDGEGGVSYTDFTTRTLWSSSAPGVVDVSNGDILLPGTVDQVFPYGALLVRAPGRALIRAEYLTFTATLVVDVLPIMGLAITADQSKLAPASKLPLKLEATLDDNAPVQDVTASADWHFITADAPADLVDVSTLQAEADDVLQRSFDVEASLPLCSRAAQRTFTVTPISGLTLSYEQATNVALPVGFSDFVQVLGVFADGSGDTQNLSTQVLTDRIGPEDQDGAGIALTADGFVVSALDSAAKAQWEFVYEPFSLSVQSRGYSFSDAQLESLVVTPEAVSVNYPDELQLQAMGTFDDGVQRDVRRALTWTSADTTAVTVTSGTVDAGTLKPLNISAQTSVTASKFRSDGEEVSTSVNVFVTPAP
jgi:hypothetical protein